jgi:sec-independent protein translocase protein TatC
MTPPDAFSQTLLAVPVWMLYELGIYASRYFYHPEALDEDQAAPTDSGGQLVYPDNVNPADGTKQAR